MNKKAVIITISSIALLGAGVGVWMYFRNKNQDQRRRDSADKKAEEEIDKLGGSLGTTDTDSEYSLKDKQEGADFPLKFGDEGRKVAILQALLNYNDEAGLVIDGQFGNKTRYALLKTGFLMCSVASQCEVDKEEFGELTLERKDPKAFMKKYSAKNNSAMRKVYEKYGS